MKNHNFEIKVALLGHVSVGKSTVLNALLRDKFSEASYATHYGWYQLLSYFCSQQQNTNAKH